MGALGALLTKIGGTALGVIAVVVGLAYLAHRRQKSLPLSVLAGASVTLLLASAVLIFNSGVVIAPPAGVLAWLEFGTYLGVSFLFLKLVDLILIVDYLIDRKGAYIPDVVRSLIMLTGVAAASLVILRLVMNINVIALVALPTVATAVVGVALRDTLVRFFSGIALGKMIRVGDWIQVQDREGMVTDIGFGHVTLVTRDHDYVAMPNNTVIQSGLINYNRPTATHACVVTVEAAYRIAPGQVCAALVDAASAVDGVLPDPKPRALVSAFNESGIEYRLRFSIGNYAKRWEIESAVRTYVWNAFQRNGFEIPFPQRVVHSVGAGDRSLTAIDSDQIVSHLAAVDFFSILTPEQIEILAKDARIMRFLPGEPVVRQGEPGQELFIILEGEAEVWLEHEGRSSMINRMQRGQFFGEMSLLTGEPRSATVKAVTPLKVAQVGKAALTQIVQEDQRIVERIGEVVARRHVMTTAAKEQLNRERASLEVAQRTRSLIDRIQDFFWGRARA